MKRLSFALLSLGTVLVTAVMNVEVYSEYFGDGPPYFGRTTNMDKWSDPLPLLATFDAITLVVCWIGWRWANRSRR
ncbi:hypothetical protein FHS47_000808 [Lutibacter sp. SG786]|nr:hypothetical protein [Luteibacter sp. SG786]